MKKYIIDFILLLLFFIIGYFVGHTVFPSSGIMEGICIPPGENVEIIIK